MIRIVADTTCGVPLEQLQAAGIHVLPQLIYFENTSYRDDTEIDTQTFLEKLKASSTLPHTAAPPPKLYEPIFEEILMAGDTALVITPTDKMSGTYRSAHVAADEFKSDRIHLVDSKIIAGGLGSIVLQAHAWANAGMDIDELKHRVTDMAGRNRTYFLVPTLDYLHKGGRIGGAAKLFGTLLKIIPILSLQDGMVIAFDKVRTIKQAMTSIELLDFDICQENAEPHLTISHCDADVEVEKLRSRLEDKTGVQDIPIYTVPPAIVVHAGPGVITTSCFVAPGN